MNQQDYYRNELQMNYFSEEYRRFEEDFYRYSSLTIPLTFLIDDVLLSMAKSNRPYFKLNGKMHWTIRIIIFSLQLKKKRLNHRFASITIVAWRIH